MLSILAFGAVCAAIIVALFLLTRVKEVAHKPVEREYVPASLCKATYTVDNVNTAPPRNGRRRSHVAEVIVCCQQHAISLGRGGAQVVIGAGPDGIDVNVRNELFNCKKHFPDLASAVAAARARKIID